VGEREGADSWRRSRVTAAAAVGESRVGGSSGRRGGGRLWEGAEEEEAAVGEGEGTDGWN
jgi:hypothetical protein